MRTKYPLLSLIFLISACVSLNKTDLSCNYPTDSLYPGGILNIKTEKLIVSVEKSILEKTPVYVCKSRFGNNFLIPIPLEYKKGDVLIPKELKIPDANRPEIKDKFYRESRIFIDNQDLVTPSEESLLRIRKEFKILTKAKNLKTSSRLKDLKMIPPVEGIISSEFGVKRFINDLPRNRHKGVDYAAEEGTKVIAPLEGRIIISDNFFYKGNAIYIDHGGGLISSYSHLSDLEVVTGDVLEKGDLLGLVGKTGRVTGPHLHWEIFIGGVPVNPLIFLK